MTGTGILVLEMTDDFSTAAQVNLGASGSTIIRAAATATLSGGIVCNNIDLGTDATPGELGLGGTSDIAGTLRRRAGGTSDANILTFAGNLTLRGNATLAGITADFGSARIDTGAVTIAGTNATAISNTGAIITGRTGAVTLTDLDTNWGSGGHIFARRWIDGTGNGVRVKTLAPHWMLGAR
ncbi:MAG TPA: hypothetical protein VMY35_13515 [Phycisphaerae bacterium]|nr:hypothetical protein [Phycisphaerae bacterium]